MRKTVMSTKGDRLPPSSGPPPRRRARAVPDPAKAEGPGDEPLAQPAHQQADDRHAELRPRNQRADVRQQRLNQTRAWIAVSRQLLDARPSHAQERIFGGGEKRVQPDQPEDNESA